MYRFSQARSYQSDGLLLALRSGTPSLSTQEFGSYRTQYDTDNNSGYWIGLAGFPKTLRSRGREM
jgi:hypothetical protein